MAIVLDGTIGITTPGNLSVTGANTGIMSIVAANTAINRTITLPDATTTLVGTDNTQLLSNKFFLTTNAVLAATPTGTASIEIGAGRTGDGAAYFDLVGDTTYTDYGTRFIRQATSSGASTLTHRGTGNIEITAQEAAPIVFSTTNTERMRISSSGVITQPNATSGDGAIVGEQILKLAANLSASASGDYFGAPAAIVLEAGSTYEITAYTIFTKTTAGTIAWTVSTVSAPTHMTASYVGSALAGITPAAAPVTALFGGVTVGQLAFPATGSLTTGATHVYRFAIQLQTNLASNMRLQFTCSAGTITPLAGSYYTVKKIPSTTGTFVG
jgi:hypothetical protein